MSGSCPEPGEVLAHLGLPADDPRRAHLQQCARCQAIVASYNDFLVPGGALSRADLEDADHRLHIAVEAEDKPPPLSGDGAGASFGSGYAAPTPAAERSLTPARPVRPHGRHGRHGIARPARWRWAAALAAAALVVLVVVVQKSPPPLGHTVLRQQPGTDTHADSGVPVLAIPRTVPGQGVELRWQPVADADGYDVVLYTVALEELARFGSLRQPTLMLTREYVPARIASGTPLLVRVVARRQGAVLSTSRAASLLTPP